MEDTHIIHDTHRSGWKVYAVFDGHGGSAISQTLAHPSRGLAAYILPKLAPATSGTQVHDILTEALVAYDKKLFREHGVNIEAGSTAIMLVVAPKLEFAWFVNLGDSRGVWYSPNGYIRQKTIDHKPRDPDELQRIRDACGDVENDDGTWRVDGVLAHCHADRIVDTRLVIFTSRQTARNATTRTDACRASPILFRSI